MKGTTSRKMGRGRSASESVPPNYSNGRSNADCYPVQEHYTRTRERYLVSRAMLHMNEDDQAHPDSASIRRPGGSEPHLAGARREELQKVPGTKSGKFTVAKCSNAPINRTNCRAVTRIETYNPDPGADLPDRESATATHALGT